MPGQMKSVTPYLCVDGAAEALEFYKSVLDATERFRLTEPGKSRIGHAEFHIGDTVLFLSDEFPDFGATSPDTLGGTPVSLHVSVTDCDAVMARALAAGALELRKPADQSFGERVGQFLDPWGHRWFVAQTIEQVTPDEMQRRWERETGA